MAESRFPRHTWSMQHTLTIPNKSLLRITWMIMCVHLRSCEHPPGQYGFLGYANCHFSYSRLQLPKIEALYIFTNTTTTCRMLVPRSTLDSGLCRFYHVFLHSLPHSTHKLTRRADPISDRIDFPNMETSVLVMTFWASLNHEGSRVPNLDLPMLEIGR